MAELFRIAEDSGIHVEYCRLPLNESISARGKDGDFILLDYSLLYAGIQERVHLAHELGHCLTGSFYNRYSTHDIRGRHEYRADKWAIHRLIPRAELEQAVTKGVCESWELAEHFSVTEDLIQKALTLYKQIENPSSAATLDG